MSPDTLALHSPRCGVGGKLCSPNPMGVADTVRYAIEHPEMLAVASGVCSVAVGAGLVQRWRKERETEG